jgi:23S rRNA maturation-related 3'-5' exoribonuclease YhaM
MKEKIIELLTSTNRTGVNALIDWLIEKGFFTSPGSTRFHGCYTGGLAQHSFNVYELLDKANKEYGLECPQESIIIATLLHDVCKVGAYLGNSKPYTWNRSQPKGHAALSLERIKQFIELTDLEEKMIKYHMGVYGLEEFEPGKGEYTLRNESMANAWFHHPIVKVMYFCDEFATLKEKLTENDTTTA